MASFVLWIAAFISMAYLLFVFGHGIAVMIAGEIQWAPVKDLRGWKARLIGLLMVLSVPLAVVVSIMTGTFLVGLDIQDRIDVGLILVAGTWWMVVR